MIFGPGCWSESSGRRLKRWFTPWVSRPGLWVGRVTSVVVCYCGCLVVLAEVLKAVGKRSKENKMGKWEGVWAAIRGVSDGLAAGGRGSV